jgi:sucrose-6-phosphate hydrolase SacC (GH32 family)
MVGRYISQKDAYYAVKLFKSSDLENWGETRFLLEAERNKKGSCILPAP